MFTNIDAQIQAGRAPDIFRVPYYTFGSCAGRGPLLEDHHGAQDQLEQAFAGGRPTPATLAGLTTGIAAATGRK